jgi:hypothetical protein
MIYIVDINPHPGVDRIQMNQEFEKMQEADPELREAVGIQRVFKKLGRDEVTVILRAENPLFLEQVLQSFERRAEILVTPVIELH